MVPQSCDRSNCFTAAAVDANAFRLPRLRRPEIYPRALPVLVCLPTGPRLRSHWRRALSAGFLERDRGLGSAQPAHGRSALDLRAGMFAAHIGVDVRAARVRQFVLY